MIDSTTCPPCAGQRRAVIRIETGPDLSELSQITANERVARGGEVNGAAGGGRPRPRREGVDGSQIARDGWSLGL